jgi:hypothetical protein
MCIGDHITACAATSRDCWPQQTWTSRNAGVAGLEPHSTHLPALSTASKQERESAASRHYCIIIMLYFYFLLLRCAVGWCTYTHIIGGTCFLQLFCAAPTQRERDNNATAWDSLLIAKSFRLILSRIISRIKSQECSGLCCDATAVHSLTHTQTRDSLAMFEIDVGGVRVFCIIYICDGKWCNAQRVNSVALRDAWFCFRGDWN